MTGKSRTIPNRESVKLISHTSEHVHQSPSLNPTLHICQMGWFDLFIQTQFPSTLVTDAIGCPEVNSTFFTLVWRMRPSYL